MCNIGFYWTTWRYITEDVTFRYIRSCETSNSLFSISFMFLTIVTVTKEYTASILRVSTLHFPRKGARGSVVDWGAMLQAGRSQVRVPMNSLDFFNWPNPSSRTMALGSTQLLTDMSTWNFPVGRGRPTRKAENLTTICEPIV
jgi:hypothetical protein